MTTTAGIAAFATSALAQMPSSGNMLSVSGHVRTRLEIVDNYGGVNTQWADRFISRALLNLDVSPSDSLKVRISPMFTHTFGLLPGDEGPASDANFTAFEAWMAWMPTDMWSVYVGRQELNYGRGVVVSSDNWFQTPRSFDAVRLVASFGMGTVDFIYSKLNERNGLSDAGIEDRGVDGNLYGAYANFKMEDSVQFLTDLDLYTFFWDDAQSDTAERARVGIFGARFAGAADMLFYDLEGTWQYGKLYGADINGLSLDTILGVNLMDRHSVAFSFAYANDEYLNLFGNVHDYFGTTDLIGRNNLMAMGLTAKLGLTDSISAGVAGHYFMLAKTNGAKRALGMEADLMLSYRAEEALTFDFGYAFFKPTGSLKDAGADKVMSDIYVQGTLKF
jgi:hypothetical protein